ncbi:50S ribosomal protein L25 [Patescibacteria group bacterium]|nr:50S ribosomal protein L25 [Patescibacteria group bacterium]
MDTLSLSAKTRTLKRKKVKQLREQNILPANIYGPQIKTQSLEVDSSLFNKIFEQAGQSTLVDLKVDGKDVTKVLVQDVQFDPETNFPIHVDFRQINMKEKVVTDVLLKFVGESLAVKEKGGILVKNLDEVKIECLPSDLIHELEVDISSLKDFDTVIHVEDLKVPENITILDKPEQTITLVEAPRTEEELKALDEEIIVETPEGAEDEKEDGEEDEAKSEKDKEKPVTDGSDQPDAKQAEGGKQRDKKE